MKSSWACGPARPSDSHEGKVRAVGRTAQGVKGVTLGSPKDEVVGMVVLVDGSKDILVVSANGYGKRSAVDDYRITNRGGKGVKTLEHHGKDGRTRGHFGCHR